MYSNIRYKFIPIYRSLKGTIIISSMGLEGGGQVTKSPPLSDWRNVAGPLGEKILATSAYPKYEWIEGPKEAPAVKGNPGQLLLSPFTGLFRTTLGVSSSPPWYFSAHSWWKKIQVVATSFCARQHHHGFQILSHRVLFLKLHSPVNLWWWLLFSSERCRNCVRLVDSSPSPFSDCAWQNLLPFQKHKWHFSKYSDAVSHFMWQPGSTRVSRDKHI